MYDTIYSIQKSEFVKVGGLKIRLGLKIRKVERLYCSTFLY